MLMEILLIASLQCPDPQVLNDSGYEWNSHDQKIYNDYMERCKDFKYNPCMKWIRKKGERNYWIVCGTKVKEVFLQ